MLSNAIFNKVNKVFEVSTLLKYIYFGFEPTDKTISEGLVRTYHNFHKYPCSSSPFEVTGCHLAVGLLLLLPGKDNLI